MYDHQLYGNSGKIVYSYDIRDDIDGISKYMHSLLSKEDFDRIKDFEKLMWDDDSEKECEFILNN